MERWILANNLDGFDKLMTHVRAVKTRNDLKKMVFGFEPTCNYHEPLAERLIRCAQPSAESRVSSLRVVPNLATTSLTVRFCLSSPETSILT